jgi:signal transduction histidine kinase
VVASPRAERPVVPWGDPGSPPRSDAVRRWWRVVTEPISRLAGTVRAVAAGDFGQTVRAAAGPSEIAELADDVDSMRTRIVAELDATQTVNDRLVRQTRDLEYSNRDLEQFAYVASHDLQEPLRKVTGFCELLRSRYGEELDERANTYIDFAVDGARRMSVLINDLLAFSRVGRGNVAPAPQDCESLLTAALGNLRRSSPRPVRGSPTTRCPPCPAWGRR